MMGAMSADPPGSATSVPPTTPQEAGWATWAAGVVLRNRPPMERLGELRHRIFVALGALLVGSALAWAGYSPILGVLIRPLRSLPGAPSVVQHAKLVFTAPTEAFYMRIKVALFAGSAIASPVILWQLWRFLAGGLRACGLRSAVAVVTASIILFGAGGVLAFLFVNPALHLFSYLGGSHIILVPRADEYLSFLMLLVVAFGLSFEYPLILLALAVTGVMSSTQLRKRRRMAYFVLLVISAVVTPTVDPITPLALAIPLALLYEATIVGARALKH